MKGKIVKVSDNENELRTNSMEGVFEDLPKVGRSFIIIGEGLTPGLPNRIITTSPVTEVVTIKKGYRIYTTFSVYELELTVN